MRPDDRLYMLDGMRGIAAIAVLLFHAPELARPVAASHGYLAVDIFFILSGFVIARTYEERIEARGSGWFLKERLVRLYPMYFIGLVIGLGVAILAHIAHSDHALPPSTIASGFGFGMLMLPSWLTDAKLKLYPLDYPAWTLFLELLINLVYCYTHRWWTKRVLTAVTLMSALLMAVSAFGLGGLDHGALWSDMWCGLLRVIFGFPLGVLLYKLDVRIQLAPWMSLPILAVLVVLLMAPEMSATYDVLVVVIASPCLVLLGARQATPASLQAGYRMIGDTSYALYAIHVPILALLVPVLKRFFPTELDLRVGGPILAIVVASAYALTHWYDNPVRKAARIWLARPIPLPVSGS